MAKKKVPFENAVQASRKKQETFTATTNNAESEKITKTKITLSITQKDSDTVKMFALKNHTTVSDLLHGWIQENCGE